MGARGRRRGPLFRAAALVAPLPLRLRAGPGTDFDVQSVLPFGTEVSVVSRSGDFAAVDLNGDGAIDGFVFAALLGEA